MRDLYSYSLSPDQFAAAVKRHSRRVIGRMHTAGLVQVLNGIALGLLAALAGEALTDGQLLAPAGIPVWATAAVAATCIALSLFARHHGLYLLVRRGTFMPGEWKLGVDEDGLWTQGPHGEAFARWSGWRHVEERDGLVLLYNDDIHVLPVPFETFDTTEERHAFVDHVKAQIAAHPETRTPGKVVKAVSQAGAGEEALPVAFAPTFASLVSAAARIVAMRPVVQSQLAVTWVQLVGIMFATLLPPLAFAAANIGDQGYLAWQLLPAVVFHVPVIFVAAIMVAHFIGRSQSVVPILAGALLAWAVIDLLCLAAWLAVMQGEGHDPAVSVAFYYVPVLWLAFAVMRLALSFTPSPGPRLGWVLVTCLLFLALPLGAIHRERSLWSFDYSRKADEMRREAHTAPSGTS